ncbi:hypothetical protein [Streptomyces lunaelactis]|uniref:hypothetical protein n=1 Tax=Streptomyces lunaelactis TaxID=1535768 RepID=UPI0015854AD1|nr:hypothetical protein [Streptomyces lunaelactis]NUL14496.1 hypothetical protein [Streptomyces lunaelactis]
MSRIKALRLVSNADLDAYEARLDLITRYEIALGKGDQLDLRRVEALIAAHDAEHGGPSLLDELAGLHQPAAA